MGIRSGIFRRWRHVDTIQATTSTLKQLEMPSMRLSKSNPNLRQQPSSLSRLTAEENERNCTRLENMIEGWEREYYYMEHPIKLKQFSLPIPTITIQQPPSDTPTIDKILLSLLADN